MKEKCDIEDCPFKLLWILFRALPSGKGQISWCNEEVKHYEHIESEAKRNLEDVK